MSVFNIDLEDGQDPISFSLDRSDGDRFFAFIVECHGFKAALQEITELSACRQDEACSIALGALDTNL
jgi:hypothetical protein